MNNKGSIAIMFLILFSLVLIVSLFIINISETETIYNASSNEALQHKFILDSHYNYMMNEGRYKREVERFAKGYLHIGKAEDDVVRIKISENILDNQSTDVKLSYDLDKELLKIRMNNRYKEMEKSLVIKANVINPLFIENDGSLIYEEIDSLYREELIELLNGFIGKDIKKKDLIISQGDIVFEKDSVFNGIIISTQGKVIVRDGSKLTINGLLISKFKPVGSVAISKNHKLIKEVGRDLPGFIKYDIKSKKLLEGKR